MTTTADKPTTYTPGPWHYEESTKTIRSIPTNYWLATMDSWDGAVNSEANARLIAAAPELLAALQRLMAYDFGDSAGAIQARAAIAKATGGAL